MGRRAAVLLASVALAVFPVAGVALAENFRGTAKNESFAGSSGRDDAFGRGGNDRVDGQDGDDDLFGGKGNDRIVGGADELFGAAENDTVLARDNRRDVVECGRGTDTVFFDAGTDQIQGDCERRNT